MLNLAKLMPSNWTPSELEAEIKRVSDILKQQGRPLAIALFGSAAMGTMTAASDIDFAVIYATADEARGAKLALCKGYPLSEGPVDVLCLSLEQFRKKRDIGGVSYEIAHKGRVLFPDNLSLLSL